MEDFIFPLGRSRSYFIPDATGESRVLLETRVASRAHHGEPMATRSRMRYNCREKYRPDARKKREVQWLYREEGNYQVKVSWRTTIFHIMSQFFLSLRDSRVQKISFLISQFSYTFRILFTRVIQYWYSSSWGKIHSKVCWRIIRKVSTWILIWITHHHRHMQ